MSQISYITTSNGLTVYFNGKPYPVLRSAAIYDNVIDAINHDDIIALQNALEVKRNFADNSFGRVKFENGALYFNGSPLHGALEQRIIDAVQNKLPLMPLIRFIDNLMDNPSATSIAELYLFLEKSELPITSDGCFLAYKMVSSNYLDKHSRTIDNSIGSIIPQLERNQVDDNRERTCSFGYHFCSRHYIEYGCFGAKGDRMMVVKVNPKDVVSIPNDYNNAKGRCTFYVVVDEIEWENKIAPIYVDEYDEDSEENDDSSDEEDHLDEYISENVFSSEDSEENDDNEVDATFNINWNPLPLNATDDVQFSFKKLSNGLILDIKEALNLAVYNNETLTSIANRFGVSRRTVGRIRDSA